MTQPSRRERRASVAAAISSVTLVGIGLSLSLPLLSLELERMGASASTIGANTALAGVASILTVPFVPRLAARLGVVPLLIVALLLGGTSLLAFKLLFSLAWWFPIRFALSASLGALFALSEFWINAVAPPDRRGFVVGVYATTLAAGFAIGPFLLALVGTSGWPPYAAGASLFAIGAVPLFLARALSPPLDSGPRLALGSYLRTAPAATMGALVFGAVETGGFALLPVYGVVLGFPAERAATLVSAVALGSVALQIPMGLLSDRVDKRKLLFGAGLTAALLAGLIPLGAAHGLLLEGILLLLGGASTAIYTVGLAHLGARYTGADLAGANAAFLVCYNAGLALGPALAGAVMDLRPPHGLAWALAAFLAAYAGLAAVRMMRPRA